MRLAKFALLCFSCLSLLACKEQKVPNGEIPDEYVRAAQKYMGFYAGKMQDHRGVLKFSMQGKKVVAQFADDRGRDILDPRCESKIGDLVSVKVAQKGSNYVLERATFAFDPNYCWPSVHGREVVFDFSENSSQLRVNASILLEEDLQRDCRIDPGNPGRGVPPQQVCTDQPSDRFATGRFTR